MENVAVSLWPYVVTVLISVFGTYFASIHKLKIRVAVLEHKVEALKDRVDSHSKKTDAILNSLSELKDEIGQKLGEIAVDIAKINTTLSIIDKG